MEKTEVRKSLERVKFDWNVFDSHCGVDTITNKILHFCLCSLVPFVMFCHSERPAPFSSRGHFFKLLCPGYMGASLSAGRADWKSGS